MFSLEFTDQRVQIISHDHTPHLVYSNCQYQTLVACVTLSTTSTFTCTTPSYRILCEQLLCLHSMPSPSFPSLAVQLSMLQAPSFPSLAVQLSILQAPSFLSLAAQLSILQATGSWVRAWEQGYCLIIL